MAEKWNVAADIGPGCALRRVDGVYGLYWNKVEIHAWPWIEWKWRDRDWDEVFRIHGGMGVDSGEVGAKEQAKQWAFGLFLGTVSRVFALASKHDVGEVLFHVPEAEKHYGDLILSGYGGRICLENSRSRKGGLDAAMELCKRLAFWGGEVGLVADVGHWGWETGMINDPERTMKGFVAKLTEIKEKLKEDGVKVRVGVHLPIQADSRVDDALDMDKVSDEVLLALIDLVGRENVMIENQRPLWRGRGKIHYVRKTRKFMKRLDRLMGEHGIME